MTKRIINKIGNVFGWVFGMGWIGFMIYYLSSDTKQKKQDDDSPRFWKAKEEFRNGDSLYVMRVQLDSVYYSPVEEEESYDPRR